MRRRGRRRRTMLAGIASSVLFVAVTGAAVAPATGTTGGGDTSPLPDNGCPTTIAPSTVVALRPDGRTQPAQANDGLARQYNYDNAIMTGRTVVPPPGFQALTASDQELSTFGFPRG